MCNYFSISTDSKSTMNILRILQFIISDKCIELGERRLAKHAIQFSVFVIRNDRFLVHSFLVFFISSTHIFSHHASNHYYGLVWRVHFIAFKFIWKRTFLIRILCLIWLNVHCLCIMHYASCFIPINKKYWKAITNDLAHQYPTSSLCKLRVQRIVFKTDLQN